MIVHDRMFERIINNINKLNKELEEIQESVERCRIKLNETKRINNETVSSLLNYKEIINHAKQ